MLLRLLPEQISFRWNTIKQAIVEALPPYADTSHEAMNNVLMSLLNGSLQCWISVTDGKTEAIATTYIEEDLHTKTKSLFIYSVYATRQTTGRSWVEAFEAIRKYAIGEGCKAIIAITKEPKIIKIVEKFGGDVGWRYVRIPFPSDPTL